MRRVVVTGVGDPDRLGRALATEPGVQLFRDFVRIAGLGYDERRLDEVTGYLASSRPRRKRLSSGRT